MKANLQAYVLSLDFPRLASSLNALSKAAPPGYVDWSNLAARGATAAQAADLSAVKAVCAECHREHRERFRSELRNRPLL
jgi:hypothetical protein